jgi:hypothetical protein
MGAAARGKADGAIQSTAYIAVCNDYTMGDSNFPVKFDNNLENYNLYVPDADAGSGLEEA